MAQQRKSPSTPNRPNRPSGTRPSGASSATGKPAGRPSGPGRSAPPKKRSTSIVNQKQTPWGLITVVGVLVIFAAGIVIFAVTRHSDSASGYTGDRYSRPEIAAAKAIKGIVYKAEPNHEHVGPAYNTNPIVDYNMNPPVGGNHSPVWADCDGRVYDHQLANENAVHMLEHGAVWITYDPTKIDAATAKKLGDTYVDGVKFMAMTPYKGLFAATKSPITLQAWNYRLGVTSPTDPRIQQFIDLFSNNNDLTPEQGATCTDPNFNAAQSTPGHPFNG